MQNFNSNSIILPDSDVAATYRTDICGWVDRHGRFFGKDESAARVSGATHTLCKKCGIITALPRLCCHACEENYKLNKYLSLPEVSWDQETPLYSESKDVFFFSEDELRDYCEESLLLPQDLRLVLCTPNSLPELNPYEIFDDDLPEDYTLHPNIITEFKKLNLIISDLAPIVSWSPGKIRPTFDSLPVVKLSEL